MEKVNFELRMDVIKKYALSNDEMNKVRGGEIEPIVKPTAPPVKI